MTAALRTTTITGAIAAAMLLATAAPAHAQATRSTVTAGPGSVTVTVYADAAGANCQIRLDGAIVANSNFLVFANPGNASNTVNAPGGTHRVNAYCNGTDLPGATVQIQSANPIQELIAQLSQSAG